jgi:hypothetical protein
VKPYYEDGQVQLYLGDCLDVLAGLPGGSVDAVVTDPPYSLAFMSREWDTFKPPEFQAWCEQWARGCLRALRPGGHLLAFGGTRTYHRLACGVEDAGFEVRDSIDWLYGSGFAKSLDVSKAIDKAAGAEREVVGTAARRRSTSRPADPTQSQDAAYRFADDRAVTAPATEDAARWDGWGTALKPAHEPIVVARKPLAGTVAQNIVTHGTGALNIDGCRVAATGPEPNARRDKGTGLGYRGGNAERGSWDGDAGRWPPNVLLTHSAECEMTGTRTVRGSVCGPGSGHAGSGDVYAAVDGSPDGRRGFGTEQVAVWDCAPDCPAAELDRQSGVSTSSGGANGGKLGARVYGKFANEITAANAGGLGDTGGASRFFPAFRYEAKAPASERPRLADGTAWPTVKPLELMRWLVRLVTPPGGTVGDFFAGTGTTGEACVIEGFRCILAEKDPVAAELIKARLSKPIQMTLTGDAS